MTAENSGQFGIWEGYSSIFNLQYYFMEPVFGQKNPNITQPKKTTKILVHLGEGS